MGYEIRDRQDGMFELDFAKPILVGIFPERDGAERYCAFLGDQEPELLPDAPASFGQALRDVAEAEVQFDAAPAEEAPAEPVRKQRAVPRNLPTVLPEKPQAAAQIQLVEDASLTQDEAMRAFARIQQGEKIADVARDFRVNMLHLRSRWTLHKRYLQKHLAEGGQEKCTLCARPFTPSISHPDTCARCSK